MNHGKNVGFNFSRRCAHKSGDVVNFTTVACRISSRLKWYKNYKNRLRLAKVIVKNKLPRFYGSLYTSSVWSLSRTWSKWTAVLLAWTSSSKRRPKQGQLTGAAINFRFGPCAGWFCQCLYRLDILLLLVADWMLRTGLYALRQSLFTILWRHSNKKK